MSEAQNVLLACVEGFEVHDIAAELDRLRGCNEDVAAIRTTTRTCE